MTELSPEAIIAGFRGLSSRRRRQALAIACHDALAVWEGFAAGIGKIEYKDGPGPYRVVDLELPARALDEVERRLAGEPVDSMATQWAYMDPIHALQHDKFELSPEAECAYYAIHYLHRLELGTYYLYSRRDEPQVPSDEAREREVLEQVMNAIDAPLGDWLRDWWIRVWDRWITTEAPR